jgi:acetylornithine deacetylase/succinyl-diaminopimelate desuccinylase-like protein
VVSDSTRPTPPAITALRLAPMLRRIDRAHKADEYIETAELDSCAAFVRRLVAESCG